jgi:hypothetical protein
VAGSAAGGEAGVAARGVVLAAVAVRAVALLANVRAAPEPNGHTPLVTFKA